MTHKLTLLEAFERPSRQGSGHVLDLRLLFSELQRLKERCGEQERRLSELEERQHIAFLPNLNSHVHFEIDL